MKTTVRREKDWILFLKRRLERIVPMYWLATLIMFALMRYLYRENSDAPTVNYLLHSLLYITWAYGRLPVVYPGWTLEYEMAFYVLVSIAMALPSRTWPSVIAAIIISVCGGIVASQHGHIGSRLLFFTNPMYLEFALGIIIAHFTTNRTFSVVSVVGLIGALCVMVLSGHWDEWQWRVLVAGLPASIVVFCASWLDQHKLPLSQTSQLFAHLGNASYSIYLVQVFTISIACKALAVAAPQMPIDAAILGVSMTTLLIAYGVHLVIEKPIAQWFHRGDRLVLEPARGDQQAGSST